MKTCPICGKKVVPPNTKYCSDPACPIEAKRLQNKKRYENGVKPVKPVKPVHRKLDVKAVSRSKGCIALLGEV